MSIPKTIHYCWFGNGKKDKLTKKCIKSWKKYCKGYEIVEWNESNVNIEEMPTFVKSAYEAKQWAFVSDYVRLKVVYENGGIYFDTDVRLLKNPSFLLENTAFFGIETDSSMINTGVGFGAEKGKQIIRDILKVYEDGETKFSVEKTYSLICTSLAEAVFLSYGYNRENENQTLTDGSVVYPTEFFCPMNNNFITNITENTVAIHLFNASWSDVLSEKNKKIRKDVKKNSLKHKLNPKVIMFKILGEKKYNKLKSFFKKK